VHLKRFGILLCFQLIVFITVGQTNFNQWLKATDSISKSGDYAAALKNNNEMHKLADAENNCFYSSFALFKDAELNALLKDNQKAIQLLHQGLQLSKNCKADTVYWLCTRYLGGIYYTPATKDSCLYYLTRAFELSKNKNWYARIASTTGMLAGAYIFLFNNKEEGKRYYAISMKNALLSNDYEAIGYAHLRWGGFRCNDGDCEGLKLVERSYEIFKTNHNAEGEVWALQSLTSAYYQCGTKKQLYDVIDLLQQKKDSLFQSQTADKTAQYRTLYETEKKERENLLKEAQLKNEKQLRKLMLFAFIAGLLLLSLIFYLLYNRRLYQQKAAAAQVITEEKLLRLKEVIQAEEKERQRIARELHDGVGHLLSSAKLNLSVIEEEDEENKIAVENSMKIIDEALEETRNISHNLMPSALTELGFVAAVQQLARKINQAGKVKVTLHTEPGSFEVDETKSTALFRIVQEVVINMLKHAHATSIHISTNKKEQVLHLSITDDGVGFDVNAINSSIGIGWKNIFARANMIHAAININSEPGKGTTVQLQIPL
jgi:two-component system, NarL family, sensor kinase